jgi:hypothetical protein
MDCVAKIIAFNARLNVGFGRFFDLKNFNNFCIFMLSISYLLINSFILVGFNATLILMSHYYEYGEKKYNCNRETK